MSTLLNALAWALIHFLWQGALVGLVALLSLRFLRTTRPQVRYVIACGALGLCLILPLAGLLRGLASMPRSAPPAAPVPRIQVERLSPEPSWAPVVAPHPGFAHRAETALGPYLPMIVLFWSLGSILLALRLAWGLAWVQRLGARSATDVDPAWRARLRDVAGRMGVRRKVLLKLSETIASPLTLGWWRPVILVPASLLAGMPPELLEALLAHELAHIRRHDYLVNLLQSAVEVLLFYHPAVWMISRRIRIEREHIADDLAARALGEPRRLALALQELDLVQLHFPHLAQAAHGGHLMARIRQLIQPSPRPLAWKTVVSLVAVASVCAACAAVTARAMGIKTQTQEKIAPTAPIPPSPEDTPAPLPAPASAPAPLPPPPPPPPAPLAEVKLSGRSCALVRKGDKIIHFTGNSTDLPEIYDLQKRAKRDFFWFREGGKTYILDDPAFVARIAKQRKPLDDLARRQDALSKQMEVHSKRLGELGAKMGVQAAGLAPLNDRLSDLNKELAPFIAQITAYAAQIGPLAARMASPEISEAERDALEKQIDEIGEKMEAADKRIDAIKEPMEAKGKEMEKSAKPMADLGKQMEEAAKPMEALGKQMEALSKEEEQLSPSVLKAIQDLVPEALGSGKAVETSK